MSSRIYKTINHLSANLQNWSDLYITDPNIKRMNTGQTMDDRLWDYIDGNCEPAEKATIEELLAANLDWQRTYRELLNMQQLLDSSELDAPSLRFTKTVMEKIAQHQVAPATQSYINKNIIRGIGAFFLTMILGFVIYFLAQVKWVAPTSDDSSSRLLKSVPDLGLENKINTASKALNSTAVALNSTTIILTMAVVVIMGFVWLDMYLQRKKAQSANS
jgi:hypothetical protein